MIQVLLRHSLFHFAVIAIVAVLFYQNFMTGKKGPDVVYEHGNYPTQSFANGANACQGGASKNEIMVVERKPREYYLVRENCAPLENPVLLSENDILFPQNEADSLQYHSQAYVLNK